MTAAENRYSRVSRRMWRDEKFRALSAPKPNARDLWLFLLTGPHCTAIPGLFVLGEASMAEELGWPLAATRAAFDEIVRAGMLRVDRGARLVWLPNALTHNPPASPNVVVSWRGPWSELPECALRIEAREALRAGLVEMGPSFADSFAIAMGEAKARPSPNPSGGPSPKALVKPSPKPSPSQDQDQDQEQEQEQEQEEKPERAGAAVPAPRPSHKVSALRAGNDEAPPLDPAARAVFDAIVGDPMLAPITRRPADLATRLVAPGAFPGVNVLGQVLRAAAWNAGSKKPKRDGRAFLLGWLGRADKEAPEPSPMLSGVRLAPATPYDAEVARIEGLRAEHARKLAAIEAARAARGAA